MIARVIGILVPRGIMLIVFHHLLMIARHVEIVFLFQKLKKFYVL